MDYANFLREERTKAHPVFHSVILELVDLDDSIVLAFFEGDDDPSFYLPHLRARCGSRQCKTYICNGRGEVLEVLRLLEADGRAISRSLFFIDKDHNDFLASIGQQHCQLFQTAFYSIENYLVNRELLSMYWVEILHLDATDRREKKYLDQFEKAYAHFTKRMQTLMAIVLLGRGIDGNQRKLNLNNVNLDLIFEIDFENGICCYKFGAGRHFAVASNSIDYLEPAPFFSKRKRIKAIINTYLKGKESKEFIRGKYELWFFVKFIQKISANLSCKKEARLTGFKRATPRIQISYQTAVEVLAPRLRCPDELATFLNCFFDSHSSEMGL